ncbi:MAG: putative HATPase protein, partial [Hyphomicrobiales bacterium]|nr:putative HATPase protein [Hyphomicrobiales bacterium]
MVDLKSDIVGRVKRFGLKPSERTSLLPLQEAVSNSIHAIDERFGPAASEKGRIKIVLNFREVSNYRTVDGFSVTDNGIGLTDTNFDAFCRPDTQNKLAKGGKGVGRLIWLKTFRDVVVQSTFSEENRLRSRAFRFVLADSDQVQIVPPSGDQSNVGTLVHLSGFDPAYSSRCPTEPEALAKHLVGHFMPLFAAETAPEIELIVDGARLQLNAFFVNHVVATDESEFSVDIDGEPQKIRVKHLKCNSSIRGSRAYHRLFLCAHGRSVL